jgi:hypothetical protein
MLDRRSVITDRGDVASPDNILRLSPTHGAYSNVLVVA